MLVVLLMTLLAHAGDAQDVAPRVFRGQPSCVTLVDQESGTLVTNACERAVLLDQSVLTLSGPASSLLMPNASAQLAVERDFTLGFDGKLYRVAVADTNTP